MSTSSQAGIPTTWILTCVRTCKNLSQKVRVLRRGWACSAIQLQISFTIWTWRRSWGRLQCVRRSYHCYLTFTRFILLFIESSRRLSHTVNLIKLLSLEECLDVLPDVQIYFRNSKPQLMHLLHSTTGMPSRRSSWWLMSFRLLLALSRFDSPC